MCREICSLEKDICNIFCFKEGSPKTILDRFCVTCSVIFIFLESSYTFAVVTFGIYSLLTQVKIHFFLSERQFTLSEL